MPLAQLSPPSNTREQAVVPVAQWQRRNACSVLHASGMTRLRRTCVWFTSQAPSPRSTRGVRLTAASPLWPLPWLQSWGLHHGRSGWQRASVLCRAACLVTAPWRGCLLQWERPTRSSWLGHACAPHPAWPQPQPARWLAFLHTTARLQSAAPLLGGLLAPWHLRLRLHPFLLLLPMASAAVTSRAWRQQPRPQLMRHAKPLR